MQTSAIDWPEGGYVTSKHTSNDPALAEMLYWLHQPVQNIPSIGFYPGP
jgi:hypothetical protein